MKTILVPTDFTEKSRRAASYAARLAAALKMDLLLFNSYAVPHADMTGIGMAPPFFVDYDAYENLSSAQLQKQSDALQEEMDAAGGPGPQIRFCNGIGSLGQGIRLLAEKEDIALIVMGSKGTESLMHFFYGADTTEVVRRATCPVLMVPQDAGFEPLSRIAFGAEEPDERVLRALGFLSRLAASFGAEILVTHVSAPGTPEAEVNKGLERLREVTSGPEYGRIACADVQGENISRTLLEFTGSHGCDLIALVHQRHTLYEQVFDESVTGKVMGRHRIPCLVFPADF